MQAVQLQCALGVAAKRFVLMFPPANLLAFPFRSERRAVTVARLTPTPQA